ncbi:hypothetical protein DL96DRAFT_1717189 [Flagelloscypha sp. PMI_526]|nr:hypothetical protein DL96DRAFT_1717189 [Flagelloscypha sp. PMI_526]
MMEHDSGSLSPPAPIMLPYELIYAILEIAIQPPKSQEWFHLLGLSKEIHLWAIRALYHTLDLCEQGAGVTRTGSNRALLLNCARSSSLDFTKRIRARTYSSRFRFSGFKNLTHLNLWGSNNLRAWPSSAKSIMMLPLEELFIWQDKDSDALLKHLSPQATVYNTLRCLGGYSDRGNHPGRGWSACRNLEHLLILGQRFTKFCESLGSDLSNFEQLKTCMIGPTFTRLKAEDVQEIKSQVVGQSRIVLLSHPPSYLFPANPSKSDFWAEQCAARRQAEQDIQQNPDATEITVPQWNLVLA